ncbi:DNA polymerase III subunit gamma/tau [Candidatus Zinderia endosymbiont of Aphrophora alni]|uniref:DNA polymerase III subunit gamma/tau n=1 Tax=Candidatus Zinderia endosymbiont of Aphrophora alni TaxID=3077951 RepID=UPI0030CE7721
MIYRVLALKYRPSIFEEVVGQKYIITALINSLKFKMLHHAYLFIGTRGVGKTTISRILAKALNCKKNKNNNIITTFPCNLCKTCIAINKDRLIDYIEIDAASNRGIENMTSLLNQAIYIPSFAKYKIYMIDEVHMLTIYAFNSMLKILENPPKHVKFILATTEPQKIPLTILSRCLQFHLKKISIKDIIKHIKYILKKEKIEFEESALLFLSKNSYGSMRDALSLVDQAIYFSKKKITLKIVQNMLGSLNNFYLIELLYALLIKNKKKIFSIISIINKFCISYDIVLQNFSSLIYTINLVQITSYINFEFLQYKKEIFFLASKFSKEEIHFFYQIVIHGREELSLAPDEQIGFSMILLRMLIFYPYTLNNIKNIFLKEFNFFKKNI